MVEDDLPLGGRADGRHHRPANRNKHYNAKSALAKTVRFEDDGKLAWGDLPKDGEKKCAHANENMSCIACHSSWNPSCYGCHLPQKANTKTAHAAQRGRRDAQRHLVQLPDAARRRVHAGPRRQRHRQPHRPGAVVVRHPRRLVQRQPRVDLLPAADDLRRRAERHRLQHQRAAHGARHGRHQAMHRLPRLEEERQQRHHGPAADARHQLPELHRPLLLGGGRRTRLRGRRGDRARRAAGGDRQPPAQARLPGGLLQAPRNAAAGWRSPTSIPARTSATSSSTRAQKPEILAVQTRGEYLYAACGEGGVRVFDIAFIDDKGFSERISTAPVSPLGQKFYVPTRSTPRPSRRRRRSPPTRRGRTATRTTSRPSTRCTANSTSPTSTRG